MPTQHLPDPLGSGEWRSTEHLEASVSLFPNKSSKLISKYSPDEANV